MLIEKPGLALIGSTTLGPPRPTLGAAGLALWNGIQAEFRIDDLAGRELLMQACSALDRAESLAQAIAKDGGPTYMLKGIPKAHPALRDELAARSFCVRTLERLGVTTEALHKSAGRPGMPVGWSPAS